MYAALLTCARCCAHCQVNPFVGCLGTARVDGDKSASAMLAGTHGGNVDVKELCKGTRVLLPVYAKGGLLFLGDLHAQQGHGEFMGGALEVSGEVDLSIRVVKRDAEKGEHPLTCPRFYASERRGVMAVAPTMEDAVGNGIAALVGWVSEAGTLAPVDAYAYVTQTCEVGFGGVSKACGYAGKESEAIETAGGGEARQGRVLPGVAMGAVVRDEISD